MQWSEKINFIQTSDGDGFFRSPAFNSQARDMRLCNKEIEMSRNVLVAAALVAIAFGSMGSANASPLSSNLGGVRAAAPLELATQAHWRGWGWHRHHRHCVWRHGYRHCW